MKKFLFHLVNAIIKTLTEMACRIDKEQLSKVPERGPLIVIANHVNFLEIPIMFTQLQPRPVMGLAKVEAWNVLLFRFLYYLWDTIPLRRGEADRDAFNKAVDALKEGNILALSPEGTRSYHGKLQKGLPGTVLLATRSGAPLQPVAYYGGEQFWENIKRFKRTDFKIVVGNPFYIDTKGQPLSRDVRQQITDEMMYQLAALLPPQYRGVYENISQASETYLRFEPGVESNLKRAS